MPEEALKIAVTIPTRGRPESCRRLVEAILKQQYPDSWQLRLIVVDNDPTGSGLDLPNSSHLEVLYEPEPGVPFARNRGVEQALPWADVIIFIDDDELPATQLWLWTLVEGLHHYEAEVVSGPVRSVFPLGTPDWIAQHPVFQRRERSSGEYLHETYTGNTAVRRQVFFDGHPFDGAFRYTGGEDTDFFRTAHHNGARIRWVADATVQESVPPERVCVRWILARSFRIGTNRIQFLQAGPASAKRWSVIIGGSGAELLLGLAAPLVAIASRRHALILLGRAVRGIGTVAALFGGKYDEYR